MKNIFAVLLSFALLATSGQVFAAGTCTSGGAGLLDGTADDTPWAVATAAGTGCSNTTGAILAPDDTNVLSIGHAITAPTAATISVSSVAFTTGGSLTLTGKTLNVGTTLNTTNGTVTIGAGGTLSVTGTITNAGTLSANGGTLILGGNLNNTGGTFTPGTGTVKVLGSSTITLTSDEILNVLDLSALPSGSTITFVGASNHTITTLTLPTANAAGGAAKTVIFKVPSTQTLQIPAATTGCVATGYTFTGGLMTGTATATDNVTCTVPPATVTPSVSAPIFSTKEKPAVFSEEVKN